MNNRFRKPQSMSPRPHPDFGDLHAFWMVWLKPLRPFSGYSPWGGGERRKVSRFQS